MIGKIALQNATLHNIIFRKAVEHRTPTIRYWKELLLRVNVTDFHHIPTQCENNYIKWKNLVKKCLNQEIIRNAKNRTIVNKEFPTLKLFWELGNNYAAKTQLYIKLNKHMINEIRYIFKLRVGCDGSRETLFIRKLI